MSIKERMKKLEERLAPALRARDAHIDEAEVKRLLAGHRERLVAIAEKEEAGRIAEGDRAFLADVSTMGAEKVLEIGRIILKLEREY